MNLNDLLARRLPPTPWEEGDNIPWHEDAFSARMLEEHLRQDTNAASRPFTKIDEQVRWIHRSVLGAVPTRILDLACGPGLYTSRLAELGHECVGIDFAPASIAYAIAEARRTRAACSYRLADLREADYGSDFGLVMMTFGQINVFTRPQAREIVERAWMALSPGGLLVLEPQRDEAVRREGESEPSWYVASAGLFSARPHLCLTESFWDDQRRCSTERFFIVDLETADVARYAMTTEAYRDEEYAELLGNAGFRDVRLYPSLVGEWDESQSFNLVVVGKKPADTG